MTKNQIIDIIIKNEQTLRQVGVKKIFLFGSYSRGDETDQSDIDLIWDLEKPRTLNSMGRAQKVLNSLFPTLRVDTVFESAINKYIKEKITEDIIEILK